ncbi:MAG: radical SAM family heme chaperone HemW [Muribaculaceae bacterium]|nr:radical SAM family heme chaperone HemW [Muribaculaceae bacterium]
MLYVHIPFCHSKCAYCDFYSTPRLQQMEGWVEAALAEYEDRCPEGFVPDTVYLGGGTPSILPLPLLERLIAGLNIPGKVTEFTIEANPEDVTTEWVEGIRRLGVNRVSMGVQSLCDDELSFIGRRHTARDAVRAYNVLRVGGVGNISLDLIYGLPGQTMESWQRSLNALIALAPDHISAYLLSYEPRTRLGVMLAKGKVEEASEALVTEMYSYLCQATHTAGYEHYEISNFALPGRRAVHNSGYWSGRNYLGIGPGAHSWIEGVRGSTVSDLHRYIEKQGRGVFEAEEEDENNRFNDMLITSLRTSAGIDPSEVEQWFSGPIAAEFRKILPQIIADGDLVATPSGRLAIPESRWLMSNQIILKMIIV